jgi:hypothetical protein
MRACDAAHLNGTPIPPHTPIQCETCWQFLQPTPAYISFKYEDAIEAQ